MNQAQMAAAIGFNKTTWNNYETGKSKPTIDDLLKISQYFGQTLTQLIEKPLVAGGNLKSEGENGKIEGNGNLKGNLSGNLKADFTLKKENARLRTDLVEQGKLTEEKERLIQALYGQIRALEAQLALISVGKKGSTGKKKK